jgi:hypothetical protein
MFTIKHPTNFGVHGHGNHSWLLLHKKYAGYVDYLVKIQSAQTGLSGQYYIGVNTTLAFCVPEKILHFFSLTTRS